MRHVTYAAVFLALTAFLLPAASPAAVDTEKTPPSPVVYVIKAQGAVGPVMDEWIRESIEAAVRGGAQALVVELDTPGGLDTSMRAIVKTIVASDIPVIVFVAPSGARAASAGVFITMAAHVAAMAPGTNLGAAHPVNLGGEMDETLAAKAENDAAAYIRSLADSRSRNADWAEQAVRESVSLPAAEALESRVVDVMATDLGDLLQKIDGWDVVMPAGTVRLETASAPTERLEMTTRLKILSFLSDPNVAYVLLMLGIYGIFFELMNPGAVFPGVVGAMALLLALYALHTLPVNYAGILMIVLGMVLFLLEIKVTSYGLLSMAGIVCLVVGSLMLFPTASPMFRLSLYILVPSVVFTAGLFILTVSLVIKAQRARVVTGPEGLLGMTGTAAVTFRGGRGQVLVHGEIWQAESGSALEKGDGVEVSAVSGLTLTVERKEQKS